MNNIEQWKPPPALCYWTANVESMGAAYLAKKGQLKKNALILCQNEEEKGKGSIYAVLQTFAKPELPDPLNKTIVLCILFDIDSENGGVRLEKQWIK